MATTYTSVNYTWELGVDWNSSQIDSFSNSLSHGLSNSLNTTPRQLASPWLINLTDTITFVIFDVTSPGGIPSSTEFETFVISLQGRTICPFTSLEPTFSSTPDGTPVISKVFGPYATKSWTGATVTVNGPASLAPMRLLLNFRVQMSNGVNSQAFGHDPEMVVGAGGSPSSLTGRSKRGPAEPAAGGTARRRAGREAPGLHRLR